MTCLGPSAATTSTGSYFQNQAHNLLTRLLAHVVLSPEYEGRRNLRSLPQIVSEPDPSVLAMLRDIQETSASTFIRETLDVFTNMTEQTFSGVYSTASKDTQWLSLNNYAALVCSESYRSSDIVSGKRDGFLNNPAILSGDRSRHHRIPGQCNDTGRRCVRAPCAVHA